MAKGVRSARGELVDFDLLRIKENLGAAPKGSTVKAREDFIDAKFKRRMRRLSETAVVPPPVPRPQPASVAQPSVPVVPESPPVVSADDQTPPKPVKKKIIKAAE